MSFFLKIHLFSCKRTSQWERGRDRDLPPTGSLPRWSQRPAGGPELHSGRLREQQGSKYSDYLLLLSRTRLQSSRSEAEQPPTQDAGITGV